MIDRQRRRMFSGWTTDRGLLLASALALSIALLMPLVPVEHQVFDLVVVVDITQSMNVLDYNIAGEHVSRLTFVKQALARALPHLPCASKLGLGVFTEYRTLLLFSPVEVCANQRELAAAIAGINGQMAWAGSSEIAKGLYSGLLTARALEGAPALVFLTDGHEAPPINPHHRPVFTGRVGDVKGVIVGIGGSTLAPIPKFDLDGKPRGFWKPNEVLQTDLYSLGRSGSVSHEEMVDTEQLAPVAPQLRVRPGYEHLSSLREEYLKLLAAETQLSFQRPTRPESLLAVLTDKALARRAIVRTDLRWIPAMCALLAFVATYVVPVARQDKT